MIHRPHMNGENPPPIAPPTYLRVVATTRCNLSCSYCHGEGDDAGGGQLEKARLLPCLQVAADKGIRKFKFLGGDPLVRADLPEIIAAVRSFAPFADISLITAGSQKAEKADEVFAAGLDRINFSIHGFSVAALAGRQGRAANAEKLHCQRAKFIERVLVLGRKCKINYVYTGERDEDDLNKLLDWAAPLDAIVNVLDDLNNETLDADVLYRVLTRMRGEPKHEEKCPDPDSMETRHLIWQDGLRVELKHKQLGNMLAYAACPDCENRRNCREGIYALRLMHSGNLQLCMDREDINLPLSDIIGKGGREAGNRAWDKFFNKEMNNGKNNTRYYRRARYGQKHNREGDCKVMRFYFSRGIGGSAEA